MTLPSGAVHMGAARQNQVQAQPEEIGEGVMVPLNIDKNFKTDPRIEMKLKPLHRTSSAGGISAGYIRRRTPDCRQAPFMSEPGVALP